MMFDQIVDLPVLQAERFILRPLRRSDAGLMELHASERRLARATRSIPHPLPPGMVEGFIQRETAPDRDRDVWVMDGSALGHAEVMGLISLKPMDRAQSEVRYWVAPAFWNEGIASEALNLIVGANPHEAKTLFAEVFQDNAGSARVLTKLGFDYLGDAEAFSVARNTQVPTWTYCKRMEEGVTP